MSPEKQQLVDAYVSGRLSSQEHRLLRQCALDDQELFDTLADVDLVLRATETPEQRQTLREALSTTGVTLPLPEGPATGTPSAATRVWGSAVAALRQHAAWVGAFAGAEAAVIAFLLFTNGSSQVSRVRPAFDQPSTTVTSRNFSSVFQLRSRPRVTANLNRPGPEPIYRIGDVFSLEVSVLDEGNLYVFEQLPNGTAQRLFPSAIQPSSRVENNESIRVAPTGKDTVAVSGPIGSRRIRVLLLPSDLDLTNARLDEVERRATIIDLPYTVAEPER